MNKSGKLGDLAGAVPQSIELYCFTLGRGYSQIQYLDIKSTSQIQYLDIRSTSQVQYLDIKSMSQIQYLDIKSSSQVQFVSFPRRDGFIRREGSSK